MAHATNPTHDELIATLQERLEVEFPELSQAIKTELDALKSERETFVFQAIVEEQPAAKENLAGIDEKIAGLLDKRDAVALESARVLVELNALQAEATAAAATAGRKAAAKLGTTMDELELAVRDDIFNATQKLLKLRDLSQKAQDKLIEAGLRDESVQYTYGGVRRSVSPWLVECFGRIAKMNLNSSTSAETSAEWKTRSK